MKRALAWFTGCLLVLQCSGLDLAWLLSWPTLGLVLVSSLKLLEARQPADHRLVALLQLLAVGLLAAQMPGLLASLLQLFTALFALAALLAQELGGALRWRRLLLRSGQLIAAALPLAAVLFLFLPRIGPLWITDVGSGQVATTGLSPELDPLGIAELVRRDAPAARVSFSGALPVEPYWRVLVHDRFDGRRWLRSAVAQSRPPFTPAVVSATTQWWSLEPARSRSGPWDGASLPASADLQIQPDGELMLWQPPSQPRTVRLQLSSEPLPWQQQPPTARDQQFPPRGQLSRLEALAAQWAALPRDVDRLAAAEAWFRSQPFRYSLAPGDLREAGLDGFLFDQQVGFCGHYASGFTALMRAAGVPARVVSGYQGGRSVQPLGGSPYLEIRQSDAHAWSEIWLAGEGWRQVDPTTWVGGGSVASREAVLGRNLGGPRRGWWRWLQWQWWGLDLAWTRWWLSFDQTAQTAWLNQLLGSNPNWIGWLVLAGGALAFALGLRVTRWRGVATPIQRTLRLLETLDVTPQPGESFAALCHRAAASHSELSVPLLAVAEAHQQLAHAPLSRRERQLQQRLWQQALRHLARSVSDFWSVRAARR